MRIRPTELGLKGILLLAALEIAFLATSYSNLFFLLIAFCCVLGVLGLSWAVGNVRSLVVQITGAPMAAALAVRPVRVRLAAAGRRPRFDVAVEVELDGGWTEILHAPIVHGSSEVEASLRGLPRGVRTVQRLRVRSRFPFGLFQVVRDLPAAVELVTWPARQGLDAADHTRSGDGELPAAPPARRCQSVAGLRPFRTGDSAADVHWKASARRGVPIVKEHEAEAGEAVEVVLDRRCGADELEVALVAATDLLFAAADRGQPFALHSQECELRLSAGQRDREHLLRWLAGAATLPATSAPPRARPAAAIRLPASLSREPVHA